MGQRRASREPRPAENDFARTSGSHLCRTDHAGRRDSGHLESVVSDHPRLHRRWADVCGNDQHLWDGNAAGQSPLEFIAAILLAI